MWVNCKEKSDIYEMKNLDYEKIETINQCGARTNYHRISSNRKRGTSKRAHDDFKWVNGRM